MSSENTEDHGQGWCAQLYRSKAAELILYGRALGLAHNEAEDVLQETFLSLLKLNAQPEEPYYYTVRSFRNRALNYHRSLWRRIKRELESGHWFEPRTQREPAEDRVMQGLTRLPVQQREVIVLKTWHGQTFEQIGAVLEISPHTAAGRYRYGLQKLKAYMKGPGYEERVGGSAAFMGTERPISES